MGGTIHCKTDDSGGGALVYGTRGWILQEGLQESGAGPRRALPRRLRKGKPGCTRSRNWGKRSDSGPALGLTSRRQQEGGLGGLTSSFSIRLNYTKVFMGWG